MDKKELRKGVAEGYIFCDVTKEKFKIYHDVEEDSYWLVKDKIYWLTRPGDRIQELSLDLECRFTEKPDPKILTGDSLISSGEYDLLVKFDDEIESCTSPSGKPVIRYGFFRILKDGQKPSVTRLLEFWDPADLDAFYGKGGKV